MRRSATTPADIVRSPRLDLATRVHEMDTPTLRAELARVLTVTADTLVYLAAVWRELERRGEDLSALRSGIGQYIPLIANGQLAAEALVHFAGRISLLRAVQSLPIDEQRRLALGGKLPVVTIAPDGQLDQTDVPAVSLTTEQIRMVFDVGRIRAPSEQRNLLASTRTAAKRRATRGRNYRVRIDKEAGTVQVGRMSVSIEEVIDALRLAGVLGRDAN